jgi:16S rRNA (guanine1516-N2)-methyltransferase
MHQSQPYAGKLAVLYEGKDSLLPYQQLAECLSVPLYKGVDAQTPEMFFLAWRDGALRLIDRELLKKGGLMVEIEPRNGEQRSWPAPKQGDLAQAIGRKTQTVVDATTGWGQDSLAIYRMGYTVTCIERSPVMAALLADGFKRLAQLDWVQRLQLPVPWLLFGNAIEHFAALKDQPPDCIYLDPMFPPKRKKSALAKKSMVVLRDLLGDDTDREQLFAAAMATAKKRVVVKSPDYADALGGKPDASYQGKLLRYDVYLLSEGN